MSWTDRIAFENILKLRDEFHIKTAVVTGVAKGGDAEMYGHHFEHVFACDIDRQSLNIARNRLKYLKNVHLFHNKSDEFLRRFRHYPDGISLLYLDAHYYNPELEQKWVVIDELKALQGFKNCVIIIHDYDNGELGHLIYGGDHMGWNVIGEYIQQVNPNFHYYTNTRAMCDIYDENTIRQTPLHVDEHILDGLRYANTNDVKRYRGIIYATPREIDLSKYQLKEGHG